MSLPCCSVCGQAISISDRCTHQPQIAQSNEVHPPVEDNWLDMLVAEFAPADSGELDELLTDDDCTAILTGSRGGTGLDLSQEKA